jgi:hypothetical protein
VHELAGRNGGPDRKRRRGEHAPTAREAEVGADPGDERAKGRLSGAVREREQCQRAEGRRDRAHPSRIDPAGPFVNYEFMTGSSKKPDRLLGVEVRHLAALEATDTACCRGASSATAVGDQPADRGLGGGLAPRPAVGRARSGHGARERLCATPDGSRRDARRRGRPRGSPTGRTPQSEPSRARRPLLPRVMRSSSPPSRIEVRSSRPTTRRMPAGFAGRRAHVSAAPGTRRLATTSHRPTSARPPRRPAGRHRPAVRLRRSQRPADRLAARPGRGARSGRLGQHRVRRTRPASCRDSSEPVRLRARATPHRGAARSHTAGSVRDVAPRSPHLVRRPDALTRSPGLRGGGAGSRSLALRRVDGPSVTPRPDPLVRRGSFTSLAR